MLPVWASSAWAFAVSPVARYARASAFFASASSGFALTYCSSSGTASAALPLLIRIAAWAYAARLRSFTSFESVDVLFATLAKYASALSFLPRSA